MKNMSEESFTDWIGKHADSIVNEVLKTAKNKQDDGEFELYNKDSVLINTYTCREVAIHVAKKKGCTIRHVKKQVKQPLEEKT